MPADGSTTDIIQPERGAITSDTSLQQMENETTVRETQSILLERIASEMNRLKFYISHAKVHLFFFKLKLNFPKKTFLFIWFTFLAKLILSKFD